MEYMLVTAIFNAIGTLVAVAIIVAAAFFTFHKNKKTPTPTPTDGPTPTVTPSMPIDLAVKYAVLIEVLRRMGYTTTELTETWIQTTINTAVSTDRVTFENHLRQVTLELNGNRK